MLEVFLLFHFMSGIYIHVPLCKTRCNYCDFHSESNMSKKEDVINALAAELRNRKNYLDPNQVSTIYFGGGTPSVLAVSEICFLLEIIAKNYNIVANCEITLEVNPDDLSEKYLTDLSKSRINRLSFGFQSFRSDELKLMNRRHTARQAMNSFARARKLGFDNISIDLIYGIPGSSLATWRENLEAAIRIEPEHISAYHLTIETGTPFETMLKQGKIQTIEESRSVAQFDLLRNLLGKNNYEHYEISNFALSGKKSKHNASYWKQAQYLGIGPSAHSFDGKSRQWNIADNLAYVDAIQNGNNFFELETLTDNDKYNDFIITSLRTTDGFNDGEFSSLFSAKFQNHFQREAMKHIKHGNIVINGSQVKLSANALFVSDSIISDLLYI